MAANSYTIPGWFVKFCAFILIMMMPWASWVTLTLTEMTVKLERNLQLEGIFADHEDDHVTRREFESLRHRVEKLEK